MTGGRPVLSEVHGEILVITLNRPDVRNAVNIDVARGIAAALEEFDRDDSLVAGIVTGAGPGFCSGLDLSAVADEDKTDIGERGFAGITRRSADKPLVAAIEGFAVAGGFEIALACDLIVCGETAKLGLPEVKRALVANAGGLLRLPRRLPYHLAMEMALTGDAQPAARLAELGVVNRLVADGEALPAAISLAEEVTANGPLAIRASKRIIAGALERPIDDAWAWQAEIATPVFASDDAKEGARAYLEKRPAEWRGR
jgi:enoyl-CoA hydratase